MLPRSSLAQNLDHDMVLDMIFNVSQGISGLIGLSSRVLKRRIAALKTAGRTRPFTRQRSRRSSEIALTGSANGLTSTADAYTISWSPSASQESAV
nr:hypothetical protein CFP56_70665 [Quercus suber]